MVFPAHVKYKRTLAIFIFISDYTTMVHTTITPGIA
jgi:hypothetical protein